MGASCGRQQGYRHRLSSLLCCRLGLCVRHCTRCYRMGPQSQHPRPSLFSPPARRTKAGASGGMSLCMLILTKRTVRAAARATEHHDELPTGCCKVQR